MKAYYGEETKKALKNFPFSVPRASDEFFHAMFQIKKAAAIANGKTGNLDKKIVLAIAKACEEFIKEGISLESFPLPALQGGAGTANHMNVNEVLAKRAEEIIHKKVHPLDHVNYGQSTNDVNPSALRIASLELLEILQGGMQDLIKSFKNKSKEFKNIRKLARTHLQDAVPTTLGAEFGAYASNLKGHLSRIKEVQTICLTLNLGGTAIGNTINADKRYIKGVYKELNKITGRKYHQAENLMAKTSSQTDFLIISQTITALFAELSKIADDLRLMSSGPRGGFGEIILPELQKGSSIMPGKVNPVIPEAVNQAYFWISGNNLAIEKAAAAAELELGVMLPTIVFKLIESLKIGGEAIEQFNHLCVKGIKADKQKCLEYLENGTAYATLLVHRLGYDTVSVIVKQAIQSEKNLREIVVPKYLTEREFSKIIAGF